MFQNGKIKKRFLAALACWIFVVILCVITKMEIGAAAEVSVIFLCLFVGAAYISVVVQNAIISVFREKKQEEPAVTTRAQTQPLNQQEDVVREIEAEKVVNSYDELDGHDFEYFCADVLKSNGFTDVNVTKGSGDQGIDIIAYKDGIKYGIQCKRYSSTIGNKAVQEAFAGKTFYNCHVAAVLTNQFFSKSAIELSQSNGVLLWDRDKLDEMIGDNDINLNVTRQRRGEFENMQNKKYCQHCGNLIDKDCIICPSCGKQVAELRTSEARRDDRSIIINNSSSASAAAAASAAVTGRRAKKLPWYLKTLWIFILGCCTGGIYWIVGIILRINWKSHN